MGLSTLQKFAISIPVIGAITYLGFRQLNALQDAVVNLIGIEKIGFGSSGFATRLKVTPNLEVVNPSNTSIKVDSVRASAEVKQQGGWVLLGNSTKSISASIAPNASSIIQPELEFPLANALSIGLKSLINKTTDFDIRIRATINAAGREFQVEEITQVSL